MRQFWQRLWFPLSLSLVLLLGLVGCAVLLLQLLDLGPSLGAVSSAWILPAWAGVVVLLLPVLLLLLYFLKLRRKPVAVPSTFLWRKTIEDVQVNSLIQWLRRNLLLLLQLLTLFLFLFALLALQVQMGRASGQHYIVLLDCSASMAATDVGPSRLDRARDEALALIDARKEGDAGMVIAFGNRARVLQPYTTDRAELRDAVRRAVQTQTPTRLDEALLQADARANPSHSADDQASKPDGEDQGKARTYVAPEGVKAEVHLFSDGGFPSVPDFALGNLSLTYHRIGKLSPADKPDTADNVGIVGFNALRDEKDARLLHVTTRVANHRADATPIKVRLEVRVDGVLHGVHEDVGKPKEDGKWGESLAAFRVHDVRQRAHVTLYAKLLDVKDALPVDDEAWLVVGVTRKARVALIRPGRNDVLESFLEEMAERGLAEVSLRSPGDLTKEEEYRKPARDGAWDLVIFDRCAPEKESALPQANTFFVGDVPPPWRRDQLPEYKEPPRIRGWATNHPLMKDLSGLQDVPIRRAFVFDLKESRVPGRPPRLLETDRENALMFALSRRPFTDLVMTFALVEDGERWNCYWPLYLSFPLFLKNVLVQLGNVEADERLQPGDVKRLRPGDKSGKVEVLHPSGKTYALSRGGRADYLFDRLDSVGLYTVLHEGRKQQSFAVNLLDAGESDLSPRAEFSVGAERVTAGETGKQLRDLWKYLAVAAFLLLVVEWYVYNRASGAR